MVVPAEDTSRATYAVAEPGLGTALTLAQDQFDDRQRALRIETEFAASSLDQRRSLVSAEKIRVNSGVRSLLDQHAAAIEAHNNGSIDGETLLRRLARIDQRARELGDRVSRLDDFADEADILHFDDWVKQTRGELAKLTGPVRQRIATTVRANDDLGRVYVETGTDALVLATMDGETFLREAYVGSNRQTEGSRSLTDGAEAFDLLGEYYPWVEANNDGEVAANGWCDTFRVTRPHAHGELVAHFDARSADVYYEVQRLQTELLPTTEVESTTEDGIEVRLNATYPGGPMRVETFDAGTGTPINAEVTVDGTPLGETGDDGAAWIVEPSGSYLLVVSTPTTTIEITVDQSDRS
jgi:hypothetical protein